MSMFARKGLSKLISSVLIILMCIVMVPLAMGDKIRAAEPDVEHYVSTYLNSRITIHTGEETSTFLFHTEKTMMYRIYMSEVSQECGFGDSTTIDVYDSNLKLVKSSKEPDITLMLEGNSEYYIVVSEAMSGSDIFFEYNFRLKVEEKKPGNDDFTTMLRTSSFWNRTYKGTWDYYSVLEGSDVRISLDAGELPDGIKLNYTWYRENDFSNEFKEKVTENAPINLNTVKGISDYYLCKVKSTDGSLETQFIFHLDSYPYIAFKDGKTIKYMIQAFKPGEERNFEIPEVVYDGNKEDLDYYLSRWDSIPKFAVSSTAPSTVPAEWKSSAIYCHISGANTGIMIDYYGLFFVFADDDGTKVKAGETYHIDKTMDKGGYTQAILSFTPDKTGTYELTLSDYDLHFYPMITVFDSDRNVVAESVKTYVRENKFYKKPATHTLKVDLTAGRSYYIAIPEVYEELDCNLSITNLSDQPTPTATATPTPVPVSKPSPTDAPGKPTPTITSVPGHPTPTTDPAAPTNSKDQILAFVKRIYTYVLDREPEAEGAAFWSDELYSFRRTGAEVGLGFIFSDEFVNRNLSNEDFVTVLYKTFFGRDPEEEGMNFWLSQLASGAMDRVTVANGFIYSQEWADTCASYGIRSGGDLKPNGTIEPTGLTYAFVERMYTTALGRGYDEEGRQYWASELANFNITGEQVGASFFLSDEMNGYNLSDAEFLGRLYQTFMNREADADGEAYWLSQMSAGVPRADVVFGFTRSPEFTEKCVEARILPY